MEDGDFVLKASSGVLAQYEDGCKLQQSCISEFLVKQNEVLNAAQKELEKLKSMKCLQLEEMIIMLKTSQLRLFAIKERLRKARTKSQKLKARGLKIQKIKQKIALERELRRESQLTREQEMVARAPKCPRKNI